MKRLLKRAVRPFWRLSGSIRRPIARRIDEKLNHMIAVAFEARVLPPIRESLDGSARTLDRLEHTLHAASRQSELLACDVDLLLGGLVREVARLQDQIDAVRDAFGPRTHAGRSGLALVEPGDDEAEPYARHANADRARVG